MSGIEILVVEDEEIVAFDIETTLSSLGYNVSAVFATAEEAIAQIKTSPPQLVLMDIMLKGEINGIQAADIIRQHCHIPVVYLTAYADLNTLERAKITEPYGYLLKPFEERELLTTIEIALSRHQAEARLHQALLKEQELNQLQANFIAAAAHEFRTPLTTISSSVDLLELYTKELMDTRKQKHFNRIHDSINQMVHLLDDLLLISKVEADRLDFQATPLDLIPFCQDLVAEIQAQITTNSSIDFISTTQHLEACIDKDLLRRILTNLLKNAIQYSPAGKPISLTVSAQQQKIYFQIQDQGIGISSADQRQIFSSFQRGTNVGNTKGRGLGLSIVKTCVSLHGGQITIDSKVDLGTKVTVSLPQRYLATR